LRLGTWGIQNCRFQVSSFRFQVSRKHFETMIVVEEDYLLQLSFWCNNIVDILLAFIRCGCGFSAYTRRLRLRCCVRKFGCRKRLRYQIIFGSCIVFWRRRFGCLRMTRIDHILVWIVHILIFAKQIGLTHHFRILNGLFFYRWFWLRNRMVDFWRCTRLGSQHFTHPHDEPLSGNFRIFGQNFLCHIQARLVASR